jgi:hypothetical protein
VSCKWLCTRRIWQLGARCCVNPSRQPQSKNTFSTSQSSSPTSFSNFSSRDVRKEGPTSQGLAEPIKAVLVEMERWEKVPSRREPFTVEMQEHLNEQTASLPSSNKRVIFSKWSTCGLYGAFRLNEYAQPAGYSWDHPLLDIELNPKAFCLGDLEFSTKEKNCYRSTRCY